LKSSTGLRHTSLALAALVVVPVLLAATPATSADKSFVAQVSQGGEYEVEAGMIAQQRATEPDVKDLAITEVHDHEGVNAQLKQIASATGVSIDSQLKPEFQQRLAKLRNAPAADFDSIYIADQIQIHDNDQKVFAKEAQDGSEAYRNFAHQADLIVKRHIGALKA
jgi:putative membrane protein